MTNNREILRAWRRRDGGITRTARVSGASRRMLSYVGFVTLNPRFILMAALALLAVLVFPVKAAAVVLSLPFTMSATKSHQRIELVFTENVAVSTPIPRGQLFDSLTIDVPWTSTVATDATAVRTRGAPIKSVQFLGDGNKVYYSARLQDIIRMDEIFEKASLAQILTSPSGVSAVGGPYTGRVKLTVPFSSTHANNGELTALASWRITKDPQIKIEWGSHAQVYRGGTGSTAVTAGTSFILLTSVENFSTMGLTANQFGDALGVKVESYDEKTYTAANDKLKQEIPNTADVRALVITGEDTNGDPLSEAEMAKISFDLVENTLSRIQSGINLGTLRAINAKQFGFPAGLPPGVAILDFADDKDILNIYLATKKNKVEAVFNVAVPASGTYTLRTHIIGIEPGRAVTMGTAGQ